MRVVVASVCNNEARMLPLFVRHYERFADEIVLFDDGSTDGSVEALADHPKVRGYRFPRKFPTSFDYSRTWLFQRVIYENPFDADVLIFVDIDEHLYHPNMRAVLDEDHANGVTYTPVHGFDIVSRGPLNDDGRLLVEQLQSGVYSERFSKLCIVFPARKRVIKLGAGLHGARFFSKETISERDDLLLLHYHYIDERAVNERYADRRRRLEEENALDAAKGIAIHHQIYDATTVAGLFDDLESRAVNVVDHPPHLNGRDDVTRWWLEANRRPLRWARAVYNWRLLFSVEKASRQPLKDSLEAL